MTHITQQTAVTLGSKLGLIWASFDDADAHALCNAAIDHYRNSLSAELPEPEGKMTTGIEAYTRDQMLQALAARDAEIAGLRHITVNEFEDTCRDLKKIEAERDAALVDAKRYRWLRIYLPSSNTKHDDAIVAAGLPVQVDDAIDSAMKGEQ